MCENILRIKINSTLSTLLKQPCYAASTGRVVPSHARERLHTEPKPSLKNKGSKKMTLNSEYFTEAKLAANRKESLTKILKPSTNFLKVMHYTANAIRLDVWKFLF